MAHHFADRRKLAAPDTPQIQHPKYSSTTTNTAAAVAKPHPDPSVPPPTIQNISNHFSKLYSNHKALASLKPSSGHPQNFLDTQLVDKDKAKQPKPPTIADTSTISLTKSNSQRRPNMAEMGKRSRGINFKSRTQKPVKESDEDELQIKRAIISSSNSNSKRGEDKKLEKFHGGDEDEDEDDDDGIIKKDCVFMMPTNQENGDDVNKLELQDGCEVKMTSLSSSLALSRWGGRRRRRRSFSTSQAELAGFFSCNGAKVVSADMPPFMQIHAVDFARKTYDSLEKFTAKTLALALKKEFDGVYGPAWHCIVGSSFGSFVTHSVGGFLYFSMDQKLYVLLFKTTVQRAC